VKAAAKLLTLLFCLSIMLITYQSEASSPPANQAKQDTLPEKWEYYAADEEDTNYFYDAGNIDHLKNNYVRVWVQALYSEKNLKYTFGRFQWELDCSKKKMRGLQANVKKKDGTFTTVTESSDWSAIPSESTGETLYNTVCKKTDKKAVKKTEEKKIEDEKTEDKKSEMKTP
jgi:hypothetical protein